MQYFAWQTSESNLPDLRAKLRVREGAMPSPRQRRGAPCSGGSARSSRKASRGRKVIRKQRVGSFFNTRYHAARGLNTYPKHEDPCDKASGIRYTHITCPEAPIFCSEPHSAKATLSEALEL